KWPPIVSDAANRLGHPGRITREELVVLRSAEKTHNTELDDEVIDNLLSLFFGKSPRRQVSCKVNVEEGRDPTQRHRGSILFLHRGKIGEVDPLNGLARSRGRKRDVEPICRGHLVKLLERTDLLAQFFTIANN